MRYAVLSDIHGNLPALEAVLDRLRRDAVQRIICLGDIVGYGASPNECCDRLRDYDLIAVQGNHDRAAVEPGEERWFTPAARECILWTREQLTRRNQVFLRSLPTQAMTPEAHLCHGSLFDPDYYTTNPFEAAASLERMTLDICFLGHTHYAEWFAQAGESRLPVQHTAVMGAVIRLEAGRRYLVNPGSVGQPRDGNSKASYAVWDTEARTVEIHRVPYNIAAAQDLMEAADLPWSMSARLSYGT